MKKYLIIFFVFMGLFMTPVLAVSSMTVPILMYHHITEDPGDSNLIITPKRFRQDMELLRDYGYTPLLSKDLLAIRAGTEEMPDKPVMITFDDGYQSNYQYAYPILKETGMKATIAVISSNLRGTDSQGNTYGPSGFLSWSECREMYESGFVDIGSHTNNLHNSSTKGIYINGGVNGVQRLENETQDEYQTRVGNDLSYSKSVIEKYVGNNVLYLAYPFGVTDSWCNEMVGNLGYQVTTTTTTETADISDSLYNLPRLRVSMKESVDSLLLKKQQAKASQAKISIDGGTAKKTAVYVIEENNYIKLRDIACILNGTKCQINIAWNKNNGTVGILTGQTYEANGDELKSGLTNTLQVKETLAAINIDGNTQKIPSYLINNHYYFRMRELAQYFGFNINWDKTNQTVLLETE